MTKEKRLEPCVDMEDCFFHVAFHSSLACSPTETSWRCLDSETEMQVSYTAQLLHTRAKVQLCLVQRSCVSRHKTKLHNCRWAFAVSVGFGCLISTASGQVQNTPPHVNMINLFPFRKTPWHYTMALTSPPWIRTRMPVIATVPDDTWGAGTTTGELPTSTGFIAGDPIPL